jgi:ribokinase
MVVTADDAVHVPAPTVTPVDTTAAGDSFCGALADALVRGLSLVEATGWAVRVGAATTQRSGAQPSLPTTAEVEQLLA